MTFLISYSLSPEYHVENKKWDEFRVEFSLNAVKTKSLRATVNPKSWTHHCLTYKQNDGTVKVFISPQPQRLRLSDILV